MSGVSVTAVVRDDQLQRLRLTQSGHLNGSIERVEDLLKKQRNDVSPAIPLARDSC